MNYLIYVYTLHIEEVDKNEKSNTTLIGDMWSWILNLKNKC